MTYLTYCADCGSVHFPDQCRRNVQVAFNVTFQFTAGAPVTYVPEYDAFAIEPESGLKLCRPCSAGDRVTLVHGCDGTPCECPICRRDEWEPGIAQIAQEMSDYLAQRDREQSWPSD